MSQINKTIAGRYVLKELIGQGGMADVYLADDKILKRTVAVKIMRSSLIGDPVYVTRFHREASAAASLSHKNIVEIYDVGDEEDNYYIVMEYVPGQTLKELIHKRGALHFVEAVDIMKQVVSATAKAHSLGIVHRDLKPQNIMVTDSGVVKIGDFGIASIQSLSQVTQTDTIMGSLHYLAPEIARGEKATSQSDIYALGIVFYELLRGEVPFNGESPVNIALKHMRDEIPSVKEFNPSIPQSVENVIIKTTAKNLHDRYQNANEMLDDLRTCLNKDEEKLVFNYVDDEDAATIVAENKDFFTQVHPIPTLIEEEKPKKSNNTKKIAIISGVVVGALAIFALVYFLLLKPSSNFGMPNIVGMTQELAESTLKEKELDYEIKQELSEDVDEGIIISTDPKANTSVKKGDKVYVTISSGKFIIIENYVGQFQSAVEKKLRDDLGFTVEIKEEVSEEEKGIIIRQSIEVGRKFDPNSKDKKITLTISKGYSQQVPNMLGVDIDKAVEECKKAGFNAKKEVLPAPTDTNAIKNMKINVVIKQSLEAFSTITKKGETIILYYYDKKVEIPNENPAPVVPPSDTNGGTAGGNGTQN